jgi:antitoxin (DNA-binding transcriptional repressor) of toxin-antitoxin stability system
MVMIVDQSMDMVTSELTLSVSEFKAKCLDIVKRLGERRLRKVTITRRGKPVAELTPPRVGPTSKGSILGCMKGSVVVPPGLDLTKPALEWDPDE